MRITVLIACVLVAPAVAMAQPGTRGASTAGAAPAKSLHFGATLGLNVATLDQDVEGLELDLGSRNGVAVGGALHVTLSPYFALQPELRYAMKGASFDSDIFGEEVSAVVSLDYLELTLLAMGTIPTTAGIRPLYFAGPYLGFLVRAETTSEVDGVSETEDIKDEIRSVDFGLTAGIGILAPLGGGAFVADIRYQLGLVNVGDSDDDGEDDGTITNRVFAVNLGYMF